MESHNKQSLVISILVHAAFVGVAVAFILLQAWLEKPSPVVFELVAPAASPQVSEQPSESMEPEVPLEPLRIEEPEPIRPVPDLPDLPQPEPEPPPPPPPPRPTPRPQPEPEPVKPISYEEWARNRSMPERVQRVEQPRRQPVQAVPEIETAVRSRLERQLSPIQLQGMDFSQVESSDALQRYLADLRRRIQAAFQPSGSSLEAEAYFTVTATGRITSPRINRTSGNAAFDQSVLRTLQTARSPGPPPGNRDYTFSLIFRSE